MVEKNRDNVDKVFGNTMLVGDPAGWKTGNKPPSASVLGLVTHYRIAAACALVRVQSCRIMLRQWL